MGIVKNTLAFPLPYLFVQTIVGATRARKRCLDEYARPRQGMRVLDIGCGPGYVVRYLPKVRYCGFDISSRYIAYAQRKYGEQGTFYCQPFDAAMADTLEPFDLVLMAGLLHHLNDRDALDLLELSKRAMTKTGKLVTLDPRFSSGQSRVARFLMNRDRGESIREASAYAALASNVFGHVESHVRDDLFLLAL